MASSSTSIDEEVQALLRDHIRSFEELETLLLLYRQPGRSWTLTDVAEALHIHETAALEALEALAASKLIDGEMGGHRRHFGYSPRHGNLDGPLRRLVEACKDRRVEVLKLMSAHSIDRVRTNVLKVFADAFLLGKKKDG